MRTQNVSGIVTKESEQCFLQSCDSAECNCDNEEAQECSVQIKEVEKLVETESEECKALKNADLPPCLIEILESLPYLNGNMSMVFEQRIGYSLVFETVQIDFSLEDNVLNTLWLVEDKFNISVQDIEWFVPEGLLLLFPAGQF